jgi:hypothetical protein
MGPEVCQNSLHAINTDQPLACTLPIEKWSCNCRSLKRCQLMRMIREQYGMLARQELADRDFVQIRPNVVH